MTPRPAAGWLGELAELEATAGAELEKRDAMLRAATVMQHKTYEELARAAERALRAEGQNEELRDKLTQLADHFDFKARPRGRRCRFALGTHWHQLSMTVIHSGFTVSHMLCTAISIHRCRLLPK